MINVLHVFSGYGGGVSSVIWNLIKNVDDELIKQSIMCFSMEGGDAMANDVKRHGGQIYIMPRKHIDGIAAFFKYLDNTFKSGMFDIIHCHIDGAMAIIFRFFAIKMGVKCFIVHAHQSADKYGNQNSKRIRVIVKQTLTNIAAEERFSCGVQAGLYVFGKNGNKNTYILNNCIEPFEYRDRFEKPDIKRKNLCEELGIDDTTLIIGHVGRFDYPKNHQFLINIAKLLKTYQIHFVMVFVGDGALLDSIRDKVKVEELEDCVSFLGRRYDVPSLMQAFDVVLLPSLSEGFPTVAIEAQAAGTHIFISESVTRDADIGLGLVNYLPINDPLIWADRIVDSAPFLKINKELINKKMTEKRYWSDLVGIDYTIRIKQLMTAKRIRA